jgi:hypothetical protein
MPYSCESDEFHLSQLIKNFTKKWSQFLAVTVQRFLTTNSFASKKNILKYTNI